MTPRFRLSALVLALALIPATAMLAQTDALFIDATGKVGIGTSTPTQPLHVVHPAAPSNTLILVDNGGGPARFRIRNGSTGETWNIGHQSPSGTGLVYSDVGDAVSEMLLDVNGNLTIAGSLTTAGDFYPDYVFGDDYPLMPLSELAAYIDRNGHLPRVPTSDEVSRRGGVNMSELQLLLLEKVEELTLYTLQQQEAMARQQQTVAQLAELNRAQQGTIEDLRGRLARLEAAEALPPQP
jgi:hypothetical protein